MFEQLKAFWEESDSLYAHLGSLNDKTLARLTNFKAWTVNDTIGHLHVWNRAAGLSLADPEAFWALLTVALEHLERGRLRAFEEQYLGAISGVQLVERWHAFVPQMVDRFNQMDPESRVPWVGPEMSVRTSITARLMETWAHGLTICDALGIERQESDRIRHIADLGVRTFGWTFRNRGLDVPSARPYARLVAPSGAIWEWGSPDSTSRVEGLATEFCHVVTQTRNVADTGLRIIGEPARQWMSIAQCFAGPPEDPPAPGSRFARVSP